MKERCLSEQNVPIDFVQKIVMNGHKQRQSQSYTFDLNFDIYLNRMYRPGTSISKAKVKSSTAEDGAYAKVQQQKMPTLQDFVKKRDWIGAVALLESERNVNIQVQNSLWLAYCYFHMGQYRKAINIYDELLRKTEDKDYHIYKACCYYALCMYDDAKREALKGSETPLQTRLLFHLAHKKNDEKNLMHYHQKLDESAEDQLTLAAIHYLRGHYEEATEIYKKLLLESRKYEAINVYIALCYYKMEYFDVSLEILSGYQTFDPESIFAANLKACNNYQVYSGKNAEEALRPIQQKFKGGDLFKENDLLRHNLVVFRNGENAMQFLPPLLELFPETRLNMVIYNLKNENTEEAFNLVKDLQPTNPREYIIKAVSYLMYGHKTNSKEHLKTAQQLFQLVGASATQCDTIPGRQCMASCFFLLKQFDDVLVYLNSIKDYFQTDDDFHWNYALTNASTGDYKTAQASFLAIRNQKYKSDETYIKWLIRTYIMNGKPKNAWDVYMSTETSTDSYAILLLIANDNYKMGHFYYAVKGFEALEKIDTENEYEQALRCSVLGVFQMVIAGKESVEHLIEAAAILKSFQASQQNDRVIKAIKKWGKENSLDFDQIGL